MPYNVLHTSPGVQRHGMPQADTYPSELMIRKTMDVAYDNPTIIIKD